MSSKAIEDIVQITINILNADGSSGHGGGSGGGEEDEDIIVKIRAAMPLSVGDVVCVTSDGKATLANAAALALAGTPLGVVIDGGSTNSNIIVQVDGLLQPSQTGGIAAFGPVDVDPTTGHLRVLVAPYPPLAYPMGNCNAQGYVTMARSPQLVPVAPPTYASLGGLIADYNANTLAGSAGTALAAWADSSPNHQDLVQATVGARPTLLTNAIYGKNAVRFDGIAQSMRCANLVINSREMTIYFVMSLRTEGTGGFVFEYNISDTGMNHPGSTGYPNIVREVGAAGYILDVARAGYAIRSAQFRDDNSNELFYQGVSRATFTNAHLVPANGPFEVGAHANNSGLWAPIDVARILIYNGKHATAGTGKTVYNLLAAEYGFAALP